MERTIKFRVYDKGSSRFLHASWGELHDDDVNTGREYYPLEFSVGFKGNHADELSPPMQFTGLLDKNGKEIYEGDILCKEGHFGLQVIYDKGMRVMDIEPVRFNNKCLYAHIEDFDLTKWIIIGNIYENPELLQ